MTIDDRIRIKRMMSSDWPLFLGSVVDVESLIAEGTACDPVARKALAEPLGEALAGKVAADGNLPFSLWLLVTTQISVKVSSASAVLRLRKKGLLADVADLGGIAARDPEFEFEVFDEDRASMRLGGAIRIGSNEWGQAIRLMLEMPAVGVAFRADPSGQYLESLAQRLFAGPGVVAASQKLRLTYLQELLGGDVALCEGVLTESGEFDDREFWAEYHRPISIGDGLTSLTPMNG